MPWARSRWNELHLIRGRANAVLNQRERCLESSLYGPIDKIINSQLPPDYMVKPQGLIRDSPPEDDADDNDDDVDNDNAGNITTDSYGPVDGDSTKSYPDFIICQFSAERDEDIIKAIIEVKPPGYVEKAVTETLFYMDKAGGREDVIGIAISGNDIRILDLDGSVPAGYTTRLSPRSLISKAFIDLIYGLTTP